MIKIRKNILVFFVVSLVLLAGSGVYSDYSNMKNITEQTPDSQFPDGAPDSFSSNNDVSADDQLNHIPVNCFLVENITLLERISIPGIVSQTGIRHWQPPK